MIFRTNFEIWQKHDRRYLTFISNHSLKLVHKSANLSFNALFAHFVVLMNFINEFVIRVPHFFFVMSAQFFFVWLSIIVRSRHLYSFKWIAQLSFFLFFLTSTTVISCFNYPWLWWSEFLFSIFFLTFLSSHWCD